MLRFSSIVAAFASILIGIGHQLAYGQSARTATITITNESKQHADVDLTFEAFGNSPQPFTPVPNSNKYELKIPLSAQNWFDTIDIKILWKSAYVSNGNSGADFEQRLVLRLRRDFPDDFSFPVFFSNDRTQKEMGRLENLTDINRQWEVFFRTWQIADYYRNTLGEQSSPAKRVAKDFFWSAVKLAENPRYFVAMSDEAEKFASESVGGSAEFALRANVARSMYWYDVSEIDRLVRSKQCSFADSVLQEFRDLKSQQPDLFRLRYASTPNILDAKAQIVQGCR